MSDRNPHLEIDLVDIENLIEFLRESDDDDAPQLSYVADALEGTLARWEGASADAAKYLGQRDEHARYRDQLKPTIDDARRVNAELRDKINAKWAENEALRAERAAGDREIADLKAQLEAKPSADPGTAPPTHDADEVRAYAQRLRGKGHAAAAEIIDGLIERQVYDLAFRADLEAQLNDADSLNGELSQQLNDCEARVADQAEQLAILNELAAPMLTMPHRPHVHTEHIHTDMHPPEASTRRQRSPLLNVAELDLIAAALAQRARSLAERQTRFAVGSAEACYKLVEKIDAARAEMLDVPKDEEDAT